MQSVTDSLTQRWLHRSSQWATVTWMTAVVALIVWGWINRDQDYLSAENGLGYLLGIIGGSMMLLLLIYSLRKRLKILRRFFSVKFWFRFHMVFGVVGPLCILYHCNFRLGSMNSNIALVCMLLVAGSGIIGRYLYTRIHYGLFGGKIRLQQVSEDFNEINKDMEALVVTKKQRAMLEKLFGAANALVEASRKSNSVFSLFLNRAKFKNLSRSFKKFVHHLEDYHRGREESSIHIRAIHTRLHQDSAVLFSVFKQLPGLQLSEKLFSLWHVIHIPIFILMIITAVTHVVVVHMY